MEDECRNRPFQRRFLPAMIRSLLMNTKPVDEDRLEHGEKRKAVLHDDLIGRPYPLKTNITIHVHDLSLPMY